MGMFDTIILDPDFNLGLSKDDQKTLDRAIGERNWTREFQTKDIECWLNRYHLDKNNKLWEETGNKKGRKRKRLYHDGKVTFYDYITNDKIKYDVRLEYIAVFDRGCIKKITNHLEIQDNTTRIHNMNSFEQNRKRYDAMRNKVWYKIYYNTYKRPGLYILNKLIKIAQSFTHQLQRGRTNKLLFPW
jgi:hypothetical protein